MVDALSCKALPSFDLTDSFDGLSPDLVLGDQDHMDSLPLYGVSSNGKDFVAFLQETDDVVALGNWSCRMSRRDFDAYGFDLARGRGLCVCVYREREGRLEYGELTHIHS